MDLFIVQTQYESLQLDDYNLTQALISEISNRPEINSLSSYSRYIKGIYMQLFLFIKNLHLYIDITIYIL